MSNNNKFARENLEAEIQEKLSLACRILGNEGHDDLDLGHVSARSRDNNNLVYIKGRGLCLSEIQVEDLVGIDFDYQQISGARESHSELPIHIEIYRQRPDVNCVVHTHPQYATALSATGKTIRPVNNEAVMYAKPLPYFTLTTDLIVTRELGEALAQKLGDEKAVIMKNHGIAVVGKTVEEATVRAYYLERAAHAQFVATVFGEINWTDDKEAEEKAKRIFTDKKLLSKWNTLLRMLAKKEARC